MSITITPDRIIKDVQEEFSNAFPFLRIELFRKTYPFMPFKHDKNSLPNQLTFGSSARTSKMGWLEITPSLTVRELEKNCEEQFGLSIKVYRKSGNVWLEATMTDNWTIRQQNDQGSAITPH